jgi:hypothetical protein
MAHTAHRCDCHVIVHSVCAAYRTLIRMNEVHVSWG